MSYKIVVARYNEDIDWLASEQENLVIINKGSILNNANERIVENVGRESDSYLQYIIKEYDNLPDIIVFTQANIADHRGKNDVQYLLSLREEAYRYGKSVPIIKHSKSQHNGCWDPQFNKRIYMKCWWDPYLKNLMENYFLQNNYWNNKPISFIDWFQQNIQKEYPNPIFIYYNAIFAVSKHLIRNHPREYYEKLKKTVDHHINPAEGQFFERSWFYIFS